jgi:nicotinate-nucleotide pyrophosphorylase (carboxylating)
LVIEYRNLGFIWDLALGIWDFKHKTAKAAPENSDLAQITRHLRKKSAFNMIFPQYSANLEKLIDLALEEDIGSGDITTDCLVPPDAMGQAEIRAKEELVVCGLEIARRVFQRLDPKVHFLPACQDGRIVTADGVFITLQGRLAGLLTAERTALNFLQRLSGIATQVRRHMSDLHGLSLNLVDTRKTTPGWRVLEKYAVRVGGAANHRMGLYDGVLIKDNHIAACGGIAVAVQRARSQASHLLKIEIETATLEEVKQALEAGADVIMLDNMDMDQIKAAVALIGGRALIEVSGNVTLNRLKALAKTGIDVVSMGALTHSARAVDISMRIKHQT